MMTWRLWRSLQSQRRDDTVYWRHILVNRQRRMDTLAERPKPRWMQLSGFGMIAVLFSGIWVFLVPFLPLILLASGTVLAANCAVQISSAITFERERARYDVASVLPMGSTGASWLIARLIVQQIDLLERVHTLVSSFSLIFGLGVVGYFLMGGLGADVMILGVLGLSVLYVDFVQSILTGTVIGTSVATITVDRLGAVTTALLAFLMVQFLLYAVVAVLSFLILPLFVDHLLVLNGLRLLLLVSLREALLYGLWSWTAVRLDSTLAELNETVRAYT